MSFRGTRSGWTGDPQQCIRQAERLVQNAVQAQLPRASCNSRPVNGLVRMKYLGDIAEPAEPVPGVITTMGYQVNQQVLSVKDRYRKCRNWYPARAPLQLTERDRKRPEIRQSPVQFELNTMRLGSILPIQDIADIGDQVPESVTVVRTGSDVSIAAVLE